MILNFIGEQKGRKSFSIVRRINLNIELNDRRRFRVSCYLRLSQIFYDIDFLVEALNVSLATPSYFHHQQLLYTVQCTLISASNPKEITMQKTEHTISSYSKCNKKNERKNIKRNVTDEQMFK